MTGGGSARMQGTVAAVEASGHAGRGKILSVFLLNPSQVYIYPTAAEGSSCCAFSLLISEFGNFGFSAVNKKF